MSQAHEQGARLIHCCEGAICAPHKRIMSSNRGTVAEADWTRFDWDAQQAEPRLIAGTPLFADYERADVHCVLLSTQGPGASFALQAQGHASSNSYWISYATCTADAHLAPSGIIDPDGAWSARCPATSAAAVAIADIDRERENLARLWRRTARDSRRAMAAASHDPRASRDSF